MVVQFKRTACQNTQRISKATFLAMLPSGTYEFFNNLDNDSWEIRSFDPITRDVCVNIFCKTGNQVVVGQTGVKPITTGVNILTVTLPALV